jgi:hypothetical protein
MPYIVVAVAGHGVDVDISYCDKGYENRDMLTRSDAAGSNTDSRASRWLLYIRAKVILVYARFLRRMRGSSSSSAPKA